MSCIDWPRTARGLCSPSAQSTASVMLDLPLPLGPTITLTPEPNSRRVRSGKDLKPLTVIDFRYMSLPLRRLGSFPCSLCPRFQLLQRLARRLLLRLLLAAAGSRSELVPV